MAERWSFAPSRADELLGWAGPDAGPLAPAVASDPTRDGPGALSPDAAHAVAVRLLGSTAAEATWTLTGPNTAVAVVDGRRLLVVDETDPYGCFTSLGLYQLVSCHTCGGEHPVPISPAASARPAPAGRRRRHARHAGAPIRPGSPDAPPPPRPRRK